MKTVMGKTKNSGKEEVERKCGVESLYLLSSLERESSMVGRVKEMDLREHTVLVSRVDGGQT